jgi:mono/diheme cytochrome c family protein
VRRAAILGLMLVGIVGLSVAASASSPEAGSTEATIAEAAVAPMRDVLARNAAALCGDFVPSVAARLVSGAAPGASCQMAVEHIFASATSNEFTSVYDPLPGHPPTVEHLEVTGTHATITVDLHAPLTVKLEQLDGSWLVSSPGRLGAISECQIRSPRDCASLPILSYGEGTEAPFGPPVPPAVKRAGARETHEFVAGRTVVAQSGCLACHRIGQSGNRGPGQNLTHIGSKLSEAQIEHSVIDAHAPMPSFKRLPPRKLHDVVRFLSLLR